MRVIHLNEVIPGKLYQRGQFVTFPVPAKMSMLHKYHIDLIVNLWSRPDSEVHQKEGLTYIHWPIGGAARPALTEEMINLIYSYMAANRTVLIHCEAGVNRSVWLTAKIYAKWFDLTGEKALSEIEPLVGKTKIRPGLIKDLAVNDYR